MGKRVLTVLLALLLGLSVWAAGSKEVITIAMDPSDNLDLNPYTASDSDSVIILQNLYEGLFEYNAKTGEPENAIARSYRVSDDGLTWYFEISEDARFSDKSRITPQTFINSWGYLATGPLSANLDFLKYAEVVGKDTLAVHLNYQVAYLPQLLCQPCLAAIDPLNASSFSGPYIIAKKAADKISLRPNKNYRERIANEGVDILLREDCSQQFLNGSVQWSTAYVMNASDYMINSPMYATTFFYFNASDEVWADANVRKALVQLVPWNAVKTIQQGLLVTNSLVPNSNASFVDFSNYRTLLEKAGYPEGEGLGKLDVAIHRGSQVSMIAELIARLWNRYLGLDISIDTVPITVYTSDPSENPYDFCIMTWIGDYADPMTFLSLFESSSDYNIANYSNEAYDLLLNDARKCTNQDKRLAILEQAEQTLLNDCIVIPLSNAISTNFVRTDLISGWYDNQLDIHPFKTLTK